MPNVHDFLLALASPYPQGENLTFELRALRPRWAQSHGSPVRFRRWFDITPFGLRSLVSHAEEQCERSDVYFSLYPHSRGAADVNTATIAGFLFCGIDGEAEGIEGAIGCVRRAVKWGKVPKPAIVVNSGHGLHCYWRLSEAVRLETETQREEFNLTLRRLAHIFAGAKPEPHSDLGTLASIPRLPDTYNHKEREAIKPVRLSRLRDDEAQRLTYAEYKSILPHIRGHSTTTQKTGVGRYEILPENIKKLAFAPAADGARHKTLSHLCAAARKCGLGQESLQMLGELFRSNNPGFPEREVRDTIKWAVNNVTLGQGLHQ